MIAWIPFEWWHDHRIQEQLRSIIARSHYGDTDEEMTTVLLRAPWLVRLRWMGDNEVHAWTMWWSYYLLRWRADELKEYIESVVPPRVRCVIRPCLW